MYCGVTWALYTVVTWTSSLFRNRQIDGVLWACAEHITIRVYIAECNILLAIRTISESEMMALWRQLKSISHCEPRRWSRGLCPSLISLSGMYIMIADP